MGISVWGKLDCYCLLRIVEIKMNPKIGYVACRSASAVYLYLSIYMRACDQIVRSLNPVFITQICLLISFFK